MRDVVDARRRASAFVVKKYIILFIFFLQNNQTFCQIRSLFLSGIVQSPLKWLWNSNLDL